MLSYDEIKDRTDLAELVGEVVSLKQRGSSKKGLCPFHGEKTPSFHVYADHFKCYGCGARGDCFDFLEQRGMLPSDAFAYLARRAGLAQDDGKPVVAPPTYSITAEKVARHLLELLDTPSAMGFVREVNLWFASHQPEAPEDEPLPPPLFYWPEGHALHGHVCPEMCLQPLRRFVTPTDRSKAWKEFFSSPGVVLAVRQCQACGALSLPVAGAELRGMVPVDETLLSDWQSGYHWHTRELAKQREERGMFGHHTWERLRQQVLRAGSSLGGWSYRSANRIIELALERNTDYEDIERASAHLTPEKQREVRAHVFSERMVRIIQDPEKFL